ncbi:hypothetical protein G6L37_07270 [Agrobacterium rubi]|nr:hypothetical protein [Agrobacterium rubi]NTF25167.1 hypothetical protein [Agrobacterium rubi]
MKRDIETSVTLRSGSVVNLSGRGALGRILNGFDPATGRVITWNLNGRWRWDDQDHEMDIVDGALPEMK